MIGVECIVNYTKFDWYSKCLNVNILRGNVLQPIFWEK